jgi:hypothetical protein
VRGVRDAAGEVLDSDPEARPLVRDDPDPERVAEVLGVRDPGVEIRGTSTPPAGRDSPDDPDEDDPEEAAPDDPDEPDEPEPEDVEPEDVGRGMAWAANAAGADRAIVTATTISERGNLSMTMHSFANPQPTGWLSTVILQQYCHHGPA